jgi:hypothetical protein
MKKLFVSVLIIILMYVSFVMCAKSKKEDLNRVENSSYSEEISWR